MTHPKKKSPFAAFLGIGGAMLAAVLVAVLAVALVGRRGGHGESWNTSAEHASTSASGTADPVEARLNSLPIETLRGAMPQQSDFPAGWDVKISAAPTQIKGIVQFIKQSQVSPPECGKFIEDEFGSSSGLEAGEWITVVSAFDSKTAQDGGNATGFGFAARRKPNTKPNFADFDRRLATCAHLTFTMPDLPQPIVIDFVRADTSGITGAKAVGATATVTLHDTTMTITSITAVAHGIVMGAQANGAADPTGAAHPQAFLGKLVQRTADKLNQLS
jgi:hypothetical protein